METRWGEELRLVIGGAQAVCFRVYAPVVFVFFVEVGKLAGKSPSTELKDVRKTPDNIRDNKHRKRIRISFIKHPITQVVSRTS